MRRKVTYNENKPLRDAHAKHSPVPGGSVNAAPDSSAMERRPRVRRRTLPFTDGPFAETKEMLGGWAPPGSMRR